MKLREFRLQFYLAVLALLSWAFVKYTVTDEFRTALVPPHSPDYFSTGYHKWEMGTHGLPDSELIAQLMVHYSDDGTTHFDMPRMIFYNGKEPPWVIQAATGILAADGIHLQLGGKVTVNRASGEGVRALTINTSNARVVLDKHYAETNEWAELISPPNRTAGVGMKLVFEQPIHLQLLSKVQGKYETK